ncbi:hypothetical protein B0J12DRAFT_734606 [Macrophomina phaseolina]|uniref:Uncharacterized protein n=1 Tax=Macrophomina phaseolina TaxID=35725 RepID=A0ABQ8GVJ2_9PEZI|nr:hypothetical protein B0J12DRAFT_734606 [Macrophomina phaseolina]
MAREFVPLHPSPMQYHPPPLSTVDPIIPRQRTYVELPEPKFPFYDTERPYYRDQWTNIDHAVAQQEVDALQRAEAEKKQAQEKEEKHDEENEPRSNAGSTGPAIAEALAGLDAGKQLMTFSFMTFFPRGKPYMTIPADTKAVRSSLLVDDLIHGDDDGDDAAAAENTRLLPSLPPPLSPLTAHYLSDALLTTIHTQTGYSLPHALVIPTSILHLPCPRTASHSPGAVGQGRLADGGAQVVAAGSGSSSAYTSGGGVAPVVQQQLRLQPLGAQRLGWQRQQQQLPPVRPPLAAAMPVNDPVRGTLPRSKRVRFADEMDLPLLKWRVLSASGGSDGGEAMTAEKGKEEDEEGEK